METMICMSLEENSPCISSIQGKKRKVCILELLNLPRGRDIFQIACLTEPKTRIGDLIGSFLLLRHLLDLFVSDLTKGEWKGGH